MSDTSGEVGGHINNSTPFDLSALAAATNYPRTQQENVDAFTDDRDKIDALIAARRKLLEDEPKKQEYITKMCELFRFADLNKTKEAYELLCKFMQ